MKIKSAEILCVGTEILIGDIVNTNAAYISKHLADLGINQYYQAVVGDNPQRLEQKIKEALERCDLLIMTGGLGPTYDDLTKETAAKFMGKKLCLHEESLEHMKQYFNSRVVVMSENNKKQAYIPEDSVVFPNDCGTAAGCAIEDKGKIIIMLPGPPREMVAMFNSYVEPYLAQFSDYIFFSQNINIVGMGESAVETVLSELMKISENPTVAPYCKEGEVRLRITAKVKNSEEGKILCNSMIETIKATEVGKYIYGIDTDLETAAINLLTEKCKKVAAAESCTGGLIAKRLTDIPGSSKVFDGGIISYANAVKSNLLGVNPTTLSMYGAVSPQTAKEMAEGVRKLLNADYGISSTGIAGPDGGTDAKPVGLVYIAVGSSKGCEVRKLQLKGDRSHVRHLASNYALSLLIETITSF